MEHIFSTIHDMHANSRGPTACGGDVGQVANLSHNQHGGQTRPLHTLLLAVLAILLLVVLWWFDPSNAHLPLCTFRRITGLDCPGCGTIRATHELLHGRLSAALHYNALWVFSLPLAAYVVLSEVCVWVGRRPLPGNLPRRIGFWLALTTVEIGFFVLRNLP